jgi:hypothetical protein
MIDFRTLQKIDNERKLADLYERQFEAYITGMERADALTALGYGESALEEIDAAKKQSAIIQAEIDKLIATKGA